MRVCTLILFVLGTCEVSLASVPDLFGYGARGLGLAGGVSSAPYGVAAAYDNPAGLSLEAKPSLAFGLQSATFDLRLGGRRLSVDETTALTIGFTLPLPFGGFLAERLTIGAAFVTPLAAVLSADIPRPGEPSFPLLQTRAQTVTINPAIALRIFDGLRVGIGFVALAALDGRIDVAPDQNGAVRSEALDDVVPEYSPIFGVLLGSGGTGRIGVTYRGASVARFALPIEVDLGDTFPIEVPTLQIVGVAQYDPEQFAFGLTSPSWHGAEVSLSAALKHWAQFEQPLIYAARPESHPALPAPSFQNVLEWGGHLEFSTQASDYTLVARTGYVFAPSPTPEQQGLHSHLDNDRHIKALGGGVAFGPLSIDLGIQMQSLVTRQLEKSPTLVSQQGGEPPAGDQMSTGAFNGHIIAVALSLGARL